VSEVRETLFRRSELGRQSRAMVQFGPSNGLGGHRPRPDRHWPRSGGAV